MRALIALLLSLWLAPVWAQLPLTGAGKEKPGGVTFSAAWTGSGSQEASGGTTINYASQQFGAADPNRIIAAFICARQGSGTAGVTSVTIDGNAATQVASSVYASNTVGTCQWWYSANSSANTSGTISVTYSAAASRTGLSVYRIVTATTTPAGSTSSSGSGGATATISIPSGGAVLAGAFEVFAATTLNWSNATQDYQGNTTSAFTSAIATASNPAVSSGTNIIAISAVSWQP